MVFGKKRRVEEIYDEEPSIHNVDVDVEEIEDDDEVEQIDMGNNNKQSTVVQPNQTNANLKPLLDEVEILGVAKGKNPGGAKIWICKQCRKQFSSTYTRMHYHFFGAPLGVKPQINRCSAILSNHAEHERLRRKVHNAEKVGISPSLKNSTLTKKKVTTKTLESSFQLMDRDMVDVKVVKALCANGIPFNVLRNPEFHEMVQALNRAPKGYKSPSFEKARTTILDEVKRNVEKDLTPVKDTWYSNRVSIVSDGWTNVKHQPLINIIVANSRGAMFLYAEDFAGVEKTGANIAQFLLKAIEEVGLSNVLQVVTDNAANCKSAGKEVEKVHKHIFWSPCVVHTLNLIFKDLANEFDWFSSTYKQGKLIVKYFLNHTHALAMFRAQSKLELLKVATTRFASHYILLKRLVDCREALATTVVLKTWKDWVKVGDENTRRMGSLIGDTICSESFWDDVDGILTITKPIYLLIKFCDGDGPKMGEIYEKMDNMLGEIKDAIKVGNHFDKYPKIEEIVLNRWEKMNIPMHCLGFALTPRFYDQRYLDAIAPGGTLRKSPNQDKEVILGVMEAFTKITESEEEATLLRNQFATFHSRKGLYAMAAAQANALNMEAIDWWATYGSETPELAEVAKKVLSQPITTSSAEQNWSTYSFIHNVKRNRLNSTRADKLVFIHSNIRLLSRFTEGYKEGPFKKWDVNPEQTHIDDSTVKLEELRWKSLEHEFTEPSHVTEKDEDPPAPRVWPFAKGGTMKDKGKKYI